MKYIFRVLFFVIFMLLATTSCSAISDKQLVKKYCKENYSEYKIKFIDYDEETLLRRTHTNNIYVEIVKSKSLGKRTGLTMDAHLIRYNKKVKKGKKVTSYLIYNPENNRLDDVVAVVDNKKIR